MKHTRIQWYLKVEKKYPRVDPTAAMQQNLHILSSFMKKRDLPPWFRGCSIFQWHAMDALQNAIRDDVEQGTAHRVRECLTVLGITPMVRNRDLKLVMMLSGGNDLALLWFLMELFYKTPVEGHYSLNEQLILSSITHLDMITTLRGLERVLPKGHPSKRQLQKRERRLREEQELRELQKPVKIIRNKESPYFEKLPKPIQISTKASVAERPDLKANFFHYEIYKDPNYVPPNEKNRWFTEIDNPSEEVREHLDNIFKKFELPVQLLREASHIVDMALERMQDLKNASPTKCLRHQRKDDDQKIAKLEKRKQLLANMGRRTNAKEKRLEFIRTMLEKDIEMHELALRKQRENCGGKSVVRMLEKKKFCEFFVRDSEDEPIERSSELMLNGDLLHRTPSQFLYKKRGYRVKQITNSYCEKYNYGHVDPVTPNSSQCYFEAPKSHKPYNFDYPKIFKGAEDKSNLKLNVQRKIVEALGVKNARKGPQMLSDAIDKCFKQLLTQYKLDEERKTAEELETKNEPEKMECNKTAQLIGDGRHRGQSRIRKIKKQKTSNAMRKCTRRPAETKSTTQPPMEDLKKSQQSSRSRALEKLEDERATMWAQLSSTKTTANDRLLQRSSNAFTNKKAHITQFSSKYYVRDNHALKRASSKQCSEHYAKYAGKYELNPQVTGRSSLAQTHERQSTEFNKIPHKFLTNSGSLAVDLPLDDIPAKMPILPFYDCEDLELMHNMLKIALKHLAKDPKYVLAGLPDSHKLPLLREWTYRRYGKRYTMAQRLESLTASVNIFDALDQLQPRTTMLTPEQIAKRLEQNYSCREYILRKVKHKQNQYFEIINADLMSQTRTFWLALRNTLCEPSPRNMFFAYYPSRLADIKRFRTWQPYEFNNVQKARRERQLAK